MSAAISIRLPDELMRELKVVADATERSKTYAIRKTIESAGICGLSDSSRAFERQRR